MVYEELMMAPEKHQWIKNLHSLLQWGYEYQATLLNQHFMNLGTKCIKINIIMRDQVWLNLSNLCMFKENENNLFYL